MATPVQGPATIVAAGGVPVLAIAPNQSGGYVVNPLTPEDQGLAQAEPLYVNQVTDATLSANDTTIALQPGQSYAVIPNTTTGVSVASLNGGHRFTAVQWA